MHNRQTKLAIVIAKASEILSPIELDIRRARSAGSTRKSDSPYLSPPSSTVSTDIGGIARPGLAGSLVKLKAIAVAGTCWLLPGRLSQPTKSSAWFGKISGFRISHRPGTLAMTDCATCSSSTTGAIHPCIRPFLKLPGQAPSQHD